MDAAPAVLDRIAALERQVATLTARLASNAEPSVDPLGPDWITVKEAAFLCRCTEETVRRWCETYEIGRKRGGRWFVSKDRMQGFLDGSSA